MVRKKIVIEMDSEIEDLTFEDIVLFTLHEEMFQAIAHRNNIDIIQPFKLSSFQTINQNFFQNFLNLFLKFFIFYKYE